MCDARCGIRDLRCEIQDAGCKAWGALDSLRGFTPWLRSAAGQPFPSRGVEDVCFFDPLITRRWET